VDDVELKNAVITGTELNTKEGFLTGWLFLKYEVFCQNFGGRALYLPASFTHHTVESVAGHWICRVMEIAGVTRWSELPGKAIRVKAAPGNVIEIGHIIKDDWFNPEKDFAPFAKRREEE
jgi:hypothetical protein